MIFLSLFFSFSGFAATLDLKQAIELAMKQNAEIKAQRFQEIQASSDQLRVSGEFGPHIEGLVGIGPITKASGNALAASEDKGTIGRTILGKLSVVQPLYTWGRKSNYAQAARSGLKVKEAETDLKEADVRYQVKEAYYGFQLANSFRDFIEGGKAELEKSLEKRKKKDDEKEGYRLKIFLSEVEAKEAEVKKYFELAKEGFALRLGAERGSVLPKDEWLLPGNREKKKVDDYIRLARENRGEFRQLSEGISAKSNLAIGEKKAMLPVFAFMASYDLANTNVRPRQPGVFAYDPYNHGNWALGVGFKWDFQWGLQQAKSEKFRAEADELEAKEIFARQGIETEVRKSYLELEEAEAKLKAATEAYKTGKKWLTGEVLAYSAGLGNTKNLVEAYGAKAQTAKSYFEAVHLHHMAWANLSKVVGLEVDPLLTP